MTYTIHRTISRDEIQIIRRYRHSKTGVCVWREKCDSTVDCPPELKEAMKVCRELNVPL